MSSPPAHRWAASDIDARTVGEIATGPVLAPRPNKTWWLGFLLSLGFALVYLGALLWSFIEGPGVWGNNASQVWGLAIANYVFWLGVGHAGTLISSFLWLTRQKWRPAVNRYAEAMTLVAVAIAGLFPIVHLGRPMYVLWVAPLPTHEGVWPQWRSALVWDFWAVFSYLCFSLIFFLVGLVPDLAVLRDKARHRLTGRIYGALALGWRGTARDWRLHRTLHAFLSTIAVPLVVSVHSIVGLDFAASVMPAWNTDLYPPYFVVGALYSGFATTALVGAWLRVALDLRSVIRVNHFEAIARILLAASLVMMLSYATEWMVAWRTGGEDEMKQLLAGAFGSQAFVYWIMIGCNVLAPQLLWLPHVRHNIGWVVAISILIDIGMWFERYQLVTGPLGHNFMPASWRDFVPTITDLGLTIGAFGFFLFAIILLARMIPIVSIHGLRLMLRQERSS